MTSNCSNKLQQDISETLGGVICVVSNNKLRHNWLTSLIRREPVGTEAIWTGAGTTLSSQIFFPGDGETFQRLHVPLSLGPCFVLFCFFYSNRINCIVFPTNSPSFTKFTQRTYAICTEYVLQCSEYLRFKLNEKTKAANESVGLRAQGLPV